MQTFASNRFRLALSVLALVACLCPSPAKAQDADLDPSFGSVTLKADFLPDPYVKKLTAGGRIQTNLGGVKAYVEKAPDFKLFYTAGKFPLTIYVESAAGTTLLINLPDGTWIASNVNGQNPLLHFAKPQSGRYGIWVGTVGKDLVPATLKITEFNIVGQKKNPNGQNPKVPLPLQEGEKQVIEWFNAAGKLGEAGEFQQAARLYEKILAEAPSIVVEGSEKRALVLNNLAIQYKNLGQYAKAEKLYLESLKINEVKLGATHLYTINNVYNLAYVYNSLGEFAKAESLFRRSLAARETKLGMDHPQTADSLNALASLYHTLGQYGKAEPLYRRSLAIFEAKLGKDDPATAHPLNNLASLYYDMGLDAQAELFYRRCLEIREARLGKDHPDTANTLHNLATLYQGMAQYPKAEALYRRSLEIREIKLGKDHPAAAASLTGMANLYFEMGKHALAEPWYDRSLAIYVAKLGKEHPNTTKVRNNLAWNWAAQKEWTKAISHVQEARPAITSYLAQTLPVLSEKEQLALLETTFERAFHLALSLGWAARPEANGASAEWLLNGKALVHQNLAEQHLLARDAKDPKARQLVEDLQNTRTSLATLINRLPKAGMEKEYQQGIQELRSREQDLAQNLARSVGRPSRANPWVTLDELRVKLGPKTVFVDIARFELRDFNGNKNTGPRYVAWITPPKGKGEVQLIDLGDADQVDRLIVETRKTLIDSAKAITKTGEIEAVDALQKPLKELSTKVLHPLLPALEKYEEWIVCPDGALWLTPWNALLMPKGEFAVERHLIRHVVSGRDLVLELSKVKSESAYIFADPDYDLSPSKVMAAANEPRREQETRSAGSVLGTLPKVPRLPGTAVEAEAVSSKLKHWLGQEPKIYLDDKASEALVKGVKKPRFLTLATHGYFLPAQEADPKGRPGLEIDGAKKLAILNDKKGQAIENPLLRCGLLLAGCNQRAKAKSGEDDGILTGLEIVGLDLNGCELVVLSACETGLGDVRSGEGVAGLRQAFQLAGAKAVLASLWQVPDRETALLMNAFYGELTKDRSQAEALRQAQLHRIAARRDQFGAAHPFFWAAFALTSRGPD